MKRTSNDRGDWVVVGFFAFFPTFIKPSNIPNKRLHIPAILHKIE